jgi:protein-L-isoaspartate(D-aspartate) O-methyltransferase
MTRVHNADVMRRCIAWLATATILTGQGPFAARRMQMVRDQLASRGIKDRLVLKAMRETPREEFIPLDARALAYEDRPVPIGYGQTISQPYIVGFMSEILDVSKNHRVLEIGTGSGYQAAILSSLAKEVYSIEIVPQLARSAAQTLNRLGYTNVVLREGDGYKGWPEKAPFDRIILTAALPEVPQALFDQLKRGGKLLAPVGNFDSSQKIQLFQKLPDGTITNRAMLPVRFVPMVKPMNQ